MKKTLDKILRASEIRRDTWRASVGTLPEKEKAQLHFRRYAYLAYRCVKLLVRLPLTLLRGIWHEISFLAELDRLHFSQLRKVRRGIDCVIDRQTWLVNGHNIVLGDFVKISAYSTVMAGYRSTVTIGTNTIIGPGVTIVSFNHGYKLVDVPIRYQPWDDRPEGAVAIDADVWIGANVTILPGSRIGTGSVIGAGAVISGVVPPNSKVYRTENQVIKEIHRHSHHQDDPSISI
ncbi:MAG: acyltransferase [Gemmatimonadaceae bacterium]